MAKKIYFPTDEVLSNYYKIEDSLTYDVKSIKSQNKLLIKLREDLLQKLMSGEVEVLEISV